MSDSEIGDVDISSYSELEININTAIRLSHVFREKSVPKNMHHFPFSKPIEYFNYFFTHDMVVYCKRNQQICDGFLEFTSYNVTSNKGQTIDTTIMEMKVFITVLMQIGIT